MPSPTTARGLLGHFPCGMYPPATDQRAPTPLVQSPKSSSLQSISAARAEGRGVWVGEIGRRSPRDDRGGGGAGAGGRKMEGEGRTRGEPGSETRTTTAATTTAATTYQARVGRGQDHHHQVRNAGAGGGVRRGGRTMRRAQRRVERCRIGGIGNRGTGDNCGGGGVEQKGADGNGRGDVRNQSRRECRRCGGRRGQHQECHLCGRQ